MPSPADITFEEIRERAYDLWERHHRPEGFSIELWLMAERELRAERDARRTGRPEAEPAHPPEQPDAAKTPEIARKPESRKNPDAPKIPEKISEKISDTPKHADVPVTSGASAKRIAS